MMEENFGIYLCVTLWVAAISLAFSVFG